MYNIFIFFVGKLPTNFALYIKKISGHYSENATFFSLSYDGGGQTQEVIFCNNTDIQLSEMFVHLT